MVKIMKIKAYTAAFLILTMMLAISTITTSAQGDHEGHEGGEGNCDHADKMFAFKANEDNTFNETEFHAEPGECVMFMFVNSLTAEHDFALHFSNGTEYFGIHIVGNGTMIMKSMMMKMPDYDTTMPYWCTVEDHKEQGMTGNVIVGTGTEQTEDDRASGLTISLTIIAVSTTFVTRTISRRVS